MACLSGRRTSVAIALTFLLTLFGACKRETTKDAYLAARRDADSNNFSAASQKVEAALKRFRGTDDEWVTALWILHGELLYRLDKDGSSFINPPLQTRYANSEAAVRRLMVLGVLGDRQRQIEAHALARHAQPQLLPDTHIAMIRLSPDLETAKLHADAAIDLASALGKKLQIAIATSALALKYSDENRAAEAITLGELALPQYEALGASGRVSIAAGNLGYAYSIIGDYDKAEELFMRAANAAKAAGAENEYANWLNQLGNIKFDRSEYEEADQLYERALSLAKKDVRIAQIAANYARSSLALNRVDRADQLNKRALELKRALNNTDGVLHSRIIEARIQAARGNTGLAEQTLREVAASDTPTEAIRWEAQARLGQLYAADGHSERAEQEFRNAIATVGRARAEISANVEIEYQLPFFNLVRQIFDTYIDYLVDNKRIADALAVAELSRAQALAELGAAKPNEHLDARVIAKARNATILYYRLGLSRAYLFTITPTAVRVQQLPSTKTIEAEAEAYRRDVMSLNGTFERLAPRGRKLFDMLVAPAGPIAKESRVIVLADTKLHQLNFETLVAGDHFWIDDVILSSGSSLQLLGPPRFQRAANGSMLVVGDAPSIDEYPQLPQAKNEIALIKQRFNKPNVLQGGGATPTSYLASAPGKYQYIHFVAHAVASRERPLESAVILASDAGGYKLFARDIVREPLQSRLVTLSSCHGAGSRPYTGEGLVGLAWSFLAAGSENVIAALWQVNDAATPKLMDRMYVALHDGRDPAVALREAKLPLVHAQGTQRKPLYWAPFVLYSGS